jgi:hypothetical protein
MTSASGPVGSLRGGGLRWHGALGLVVQHLPHEDEVLIQDVLLVGRGFALGRKEMDIRGMDLCRANPKPL